MRAIVKTSITMFDRVNNLYGVGEDWITFDKSAYLLDQMVQDNDKPLVLYIKNHPYPLVMRSANDQKINGMCRKHIMTKRTIEQLQFVTHPIDDSLYV